MNKGFLLTALIVGGLLTWYIWVKLGGMIALLPLVVLLLLFVFVQFRSQGAT
jgi:hypothetical protein